MLLNVPSAQHPPTAEFLNLGMTEILNYVNCLLMMYGVGLAPAHQMLVASPPCNVTIRNLQMLTASKGGIGSTEVGDHGAVR